MSTDWQENPKIQNIKCTRDNRVETGVVRFNDDWPGVFIRGDNAFAYAQYLKVLLAIHRESETQTLAAGEIEGLVETLESCDIRNLGRSVSASSTQKPT